MNSFDIYLINLRKQGHKKTLNGVIMSVNYVIKLLSHEYKNARSDANTRKKEQTPKYSVILIVNTWV